jgi:hypothetical protein
MSSAAKSEAPTAAANMEAMRANIDQPADSQVVENPAASPTSAIAAALFRSDRVGFDSSGTVLSSLFEDAVAKQTRLRPIQNQIRDQ